MGHQPVLHLDWETRSACDLKRAGLHAYAEHPSTDILLGGYAFDDETPMVWFKGDGIPTRILDHISSGFPVWAHNATFEFELCNSVGVRYGWPLLKIEQMNCTLALGHAMALPGALDKMAPALGLEVQKDALGKRLMLKLCAPREVKEDGTYVWWEEPADIKRLAEYCKQDIVVEREIKKRLLLPTPFERRVWELDQKINRRGIQIDTKSARVAMEIVEMEMDRLNKEMRRITGNEVATCNATKQLTDWLKDYGLDVDGIAKADVLALLETEGLPEVCREALLIRQEAAKSSTAKLRMMLDGVCKDGRIRGLFQYSGAGSTGRWAGRRIQPQNFPRPKIETKEINEVFKLLQEVP